jgi:hypothetical protein
VRWSCVPLAFEFYLRRQAQTYTPHVYGRVREVVAAEQKVEVKNDHFAPVLLSWFEPGPVLYYARYGYI